MLVNVSYKDRKLTERINETVGKPFNLRERWKHKGIGSPKLQITSCSMDIHNLLVLDQNLNTCNIELRPRGIILRFRSILETFALIIPYYKLSVYKGKSEEYSLYKDHHFIKVAAKKPEVHNFISKMLRIKDEQRFDHVDDL
ncbi:hypothetical protein [Robertkochia sediminum]|uniref:hypothetical protein n=1 Tax=Robertkochia sediminum TaxID=2785326 RepID=UPI001932579A|nr:hypothetical protein [Robertkochia sediminum]MBL7472768.1 hypothetical protein [Robertkochia sediminum]